MKALFRNTSSVIQILNATVFPMTHLHSVTLKYLTPSTAICNDTETPQKRLALTVQECPPLQYLTVQEHLTLQHQQCQGA